MSELDETEAGRPGVKGTARERQVLEAREMATNYVAMGGEVWMSIRSLFCKILSGSTDHDTTSFAIFHCIVSLAGSLVGLRRDRVKHPLPHLAFVSHQLLLITRRIRPASYESRALRGLLTALAVKTVTRVHTTQHTAIAAETQNAESLAKPFAKHVGRVLFAYIDYMNDPLYILTLDVRRELESGLLFSLCEMLGEYNRDVLMVCTGFRWQDSHEVALEGKYLRLSEGDETSSREGAPRHKL
ncbi:hypothetical protein M404DRAFT_24973 [Pisolithus tinctorius Marx 270]|uniref:Nucleolar 27S pre-rRNA processing Urb2/Npa2 C-terminal domain-containing protein n=1 Tax=Pisolithus tinctorius Marx 270 TaxID=870435 RepID=A0A0C3K9F1_PISTI|nr:hypothetical protein M404DRAFT_24973 [Pisolithus tinctorius Marx 270]